MTIDVEARQDLLARFDFLRQDQSHAVHRAVGDLRFVELPVFFVGGGDELNLAIARRARFGAPLIVITSGNLKFS